jgi:Caspase domain
MPREGDEGLRIKNRSVEWRIRLHPSFLFFFFAVLWICAGCLLISFNASGQTFQGGTSSGTAPGKEGRPKKLALLVGINEYKYVTPLKGAVNDVMNMRRLLVERFGFPDDDKHIRILTNRQATRGAILKALKEHLIDKATPESIVVFHYSGHGSRVKDRDPVGTEGYETDGYDESIVPYDSGRDEAPNRDILDDELNALLRRLTDRTPHVTFIFDSCHSGTAIRGAGPARTVKPDHRPPPKQEASGPAARGVNEGKNDLRPANARYALISACAADELARELPVESQFHGALSWHLADSIRRAGPGVTYRDIMDVVQSRVSAAYPGQHPQLEGPGQDQLVFGDTSLEPMAYVPVKAGPPGTVRIEAGQVHGVTRGSIYDVYPPGTKSFGPENPPVTAIEIIDVETTSSRAKVRGEKPVEEASRAVERDHHWADPALQVHFKGLAKSETLRKIKAELQPFKHIAPVEREMGYNLLLREGGQKKNGEIYIITEGGDPTEISPRVAVNDPDAVRRVVMQVTHWAKWFNLLRIRNQDPALGFEFEVSMKKAGGPAGPHDGQVSLSLFEGEKFAVRVTNRSSKDLFIALLDLSNDGSVEVVYPAGGQQEFVAPGATWEKELETTLPAGRDSLRDVLKLIVTARYADFTFLRQGPVRGGPRLAEGLRGSRHPLEELLANASMGTMRSGVKRVEVGDWATRERVLEIRRRR